MIDEIIIQISHEYRTGQYRRMIRKNDKACFLGKLANHGGICSFALLNLASRHAPAIALRLMIMPVKHEEFSIMLDEAADYFESAIEVRGFFEINHMQISIRSKVPSRNLI